MDLKYSHAMMEPEMMQRGSSRTVFAKTCPGSPDSLPCMTNATTRATREKLCNDCQTLIAYSWRRLVENTHLYGHFDFKDQKMLRRQLTTVPQIQVLWEAGQNGLRQQLRETQTNIVTFGSSKPLPGLQYTANRDVAIATTARTTWKMAPLCLIRTTKPFDTYSDL